MQKKRVSIYIYKRGGWIYFLLVACNIIRILFASAIVAADAVDAAAAAVVEYT